MGKNQKTQDGRGRGGDRSSGSSGILREFSSGGVVYKGNHWLIRATSPSKLFPKSHWMLPKGHIDNDESTQTTAIREVAEETGVEARIIAKIRTIKYFYKHPESGNVFKFVTFYLMEYVKDLPDGFDMETSEISWLPFDEAYKKLSFSGEKQILKKAKQLLEEGTQSSLV